MPPEDDPDFPELEQALRRADVSAGAAEVHGMLCAVMSVPGKGRVESWLEEVLGDGARSPTRCRALLLGLAARTARELTSDDLDLRLLLPADTAPVAERVQALGDWCAGYVFGLQLAGAGDLDKLEPDSREVVEDLAEFMRMDAGGDSSEESERALMELVEYVRVGVIIVSRDLAARRH